MVQSVPPKLHFQKADQFEDFLRAAAGNDDGIGNGRRVELHVEGGTYAKKQNGMTWAQPFTRFVCVAWRPREGGSGPFDLEEVTWTISVDDKEEEWLAKIKQALGARNFVVDVVR
ncbi:MAG: hypothetical protein HPY44_03925 [Armatimonadetes bacterium]|nr:hypothetical protein [Armatimonadota bacterium]